MITYLDMAVLTANAYRDRLIRTELEVEARGHSVHCTAVRQLPTVNDIESILYVLPEAYVIQFRGTEFMSKQNGFWRNFLDVIRDIRCWPWYTEFGWGHAGFARGAKAWFHENYHLIPSDKPLIIGGHSMGGQLAPWVALMLSQYSSFNVHRVVNFAEPKGFFTSSKTTYRLRGLDSITRSFLTQRDIIEDVPPWGKRSVIPIYVGRGGHSMSDYIDALKVSAYGQADVFDLKPL